LIVVLDGADEESRRLAKQSGARLVHLARPSGPAVARNVGSRIARGELLLFIDADVSVHPATVATVVQKFRDHPNVQAVIGSYDDRPSSERFLSQYKNLFHHFVHQNAREEGSTFWGACGAIDRDVFLQVGGFDERYRQPSIEDIELGYRLKAAGHRIHVCKTLQVRHHKHWSAISLLRSDFFRRALPWSELILRTHRFENDLNISRSNRLKVALAWVLLGCLVLSAWWLPGLAVATCLAVALMALDAPLLRFFQQRRGVVFAIRTIPWHWFHYLYSGAGFAVALLAQVGRSLVLQRQPGRSLVETLTPPAEGLKTVQ
jgi:GT2 family glycosyltransferase